MRLAFMRFGKKFWSLYSLTKMQRCRIIRIPNQISSMYQDDGILFPCTSGAGGWKSHIPGNAMVSSFGYKARTYFWDYKRAGHTSAGTIHSWSFHSSRSIDHPSSVRGCAPVLSHMSWRCWRTTCLQEMHWLQSSHYVRFYSYTCWLLKLWAWSSTKARPSGQTCNFDGSFCLFIGPPTFPVRMSTWQSPRRVELQRTNWNL